MSATAATVPARAPQPAPPLDLGSPRRLHVVGVGGPGMSAIATVLAEMGHDVSGSDIREQPILERLRAAGVRVVVGHDRAIVHGCDAVTWSTAIPRTNIEIDEAIRTGVTVVRRAGMLASICARADSIGVAGAHGKTTTSSMLMLILAEAGLRPSFVIGGDVADLGTGAQWTGSRWLVVEADESDATHVELPLYASIVTNVERDFLQHYGTAEALFDSFRTYLRQIPGPRVLCADDPLCAEMAEQFAGITYGLAAGADVRAEDVRAAGGAMVFRVRAHGTDLGELRLPLRGEHNVVNATGALAMALALGVDPDVAATALARFGGVARRFDVRGTWNGATLVDDYGHLPSEILAVTRAARHSGDGWGRLVAVFQPNRYNRIAEMWKDYADAFVEADLVVLTDIYPSGTQPIPGVTGKLLVNAVTEAHPEARVVWLPRRADLVAFLVRELGAGDVCLSMGCGDIATLPGEVMRYGADRAAGR